MALEHIERADSLVESVLQKITHAIIIGEIAPDDKLVETRLAEQLGVSRGPVREAFRRLEQMGLVEKVPYRGTFVSTLTDRDVQELYRVRELLEGLAARIVAERNDPADVATLQAALGEIQQAVDAGPYPEVFMRDADFHDTLIAVSRQKLLGEVWAPVSIRLRRLLLLKRERPLHTVQEVVRVHKPLMEAIAAGDAERAEAEARRHVVNSAQNFWRAEGQHGDGS